MERSEQLSPRLHGEKSPLPPIICERDKIALKEVQDYVAKELQKARCMTPGPNNKRFSIYSTAFSMLISKVTVYRDILSDIKREYEDCINALRNGEREAKFLQVKLKTMSSIPTTYNSYLRRQKELEERLGILNAENVRLENVLNELIKSQEEEGSEEDNENEEQDLAKPERIEKRPIPGLPVADWTNEMALKSALERLNDVLAELRKQMKTSYVPVEKREEVLQEFREKMEEKERLAEECQKLKKRHKILKMANEAAREYKELGLYRTGQSLSEFILKKVTDYSIKRESAHMVDSPYSAFDDDDPSKEKEAEMILEYIEKFNEFFFDGDYTDAATHAAIGPKGVLRDMETLLRFKEVSENYIGVPSPLLMFAEAFMYSSSAQNHYADEEISYECVNRALIENRPGMVLHWVVQGCVKTCKKVADRLAEFARSSDPPHNSCLAAAQKMYSETEGCNILAAALLHELEQPFRMLDFSSYENFTKETYFELIKECMNGDLVWILSRAPVEEYSSSEDPKGRFRKYEPPLPIPLSQSLVSLLDVGEKGRDVVVTLLGEIFDGQKSENLESKEEDDALFVASNLSKIIYQDGEDPFDNDDLVKRRWKTLAAECENQNKTEVAMDIRAALVVRATIMKAVSVIAEDEKEQFDYYT